MLLSTRKLSSKELIQLAAGKTLADLMTWLEKMDGPRGFSLRAGRKTH